MKIRNVFCSRYTVLPQLSLLTLRLCDATWTCVQRFPGRISQHDLQSVTDPMAAKISSLPLRTLNNFSNLCNP